MVVAEGSTCLPHLLPFLVREVCKISMGNEGSDC
jgi:hypothetical protein